MICAVHQPQYLPWLGFFSKLDAADIFVIYDDIPYKHDDWQNRSRIKTVNPKKPVQWLTVPVHHTQGELIRDIRIDNSKPWRRKHANSLAANYARAAFYKDYADDLSAIYAGEWDRLAPLDVELIQLLCRWLGIATPMVFSSQLGYEGRSTDALISICRKTGADLYLSGPGGRAYLETEKFGKKTGVELLFHEYEQPVYPQQFGQFAARMSVVDLLLNCGHESLHILRSGRTITPFAASEKPGRQ